MIPILSLDSPSSLLTPIREPSFLIHQLIDKKKNHLEFEKQFQLCLNQGIAPTEEELILLNAHGYAVSHDPLTIDRFRTFVFPGDAEHTLAIQSATSRTGLLVDRFKMYRPGPASAAHTNGAAKGYDEIFALFEENTTEKERIGQDARRFIQLLNDHLPMEHPWRQEHAQQTVLDMGCGNGVQTARMCAGAAWRVIGLDNQAGCIEKCQTLLPNQTFIAHDLFQSAPDLLKKRAEIVFISHVYCKPDQAAHLIEQIKECQASHNALLIFVNGTTGTDADRLANELPFLRGKPTPSMSQEYQKALKHHGYTYITYVRQAKVSFPHLTPALRHQLLNIQRGDYENPYPHIDPDFKIFKGLMEFIASFPLESMTPEEIERYILALEDTFKNNGGSFLKICNQMVLAHPQDADELFIQAFAKAQQLDNIDYQFACIMDQAESNYLAEAKDTLRTLLQSLNGKNHEKTLRGFELMSDLCLKEDQFPEAAGILWYTKRLASNPELEIHLDQKIEVVERTLLQKFSAISSGIRGISQSRIDQEKLKALRTRIKEKYELISGMTDTRIKVDHLRALYQEIAREMKLFIHELSQDVILQLGEWGHKSRVNMRL